MQNFVGEICKFPHSSKTLDNHHQDSEDLKIRHQPESNLENTMESMLLAQRQLDEAIKQLASKVDFLTSRNKILENQIVG